MEEAAILPRFPVAFPLPAFASRSSCSRRGVGPPLRSAYRDPPKARPDPDGVTAFRTRELRSGWVPSLPRGQRCCPGQVVSLTGTCRSTAASPYTPPQRPTLAGLCFTRHRRGFKQLTRPVFPPPVAARMERAALGLSPGLRTPPTRTRRGTPGWGQAIEYGPGTTRSTSHQSILQSCSSLTTCDLASHDDEQERGLAVLLLDDSGSAGLALAPPKTQHSMVAGVSGAVLKFGAGRKKALLGARHRRTRPEFAVLRFGSSAGCFRLRASIESR